MSSPNQRYRSSPIASRRLLHHLRLSGLISGADILTRTKETTSSLQGSHSKMWSMLCPRAPWLRALLARSTFLIGPRWLLFSLNLFLQFLKCFVASVAVGNMNSYFNNLPGRQPVEPIQSQPFDFWAFLPSHDVPGRHFFFSILRRWRRREAGSFSIKAF